jgi:hypothetical protein
MERPFPATGECATTRQLGALRQEAASQEGGMTAQPGRVQLLEARQTGDAMPSSADSADSSNTSDIAVTDAGLEVSTPVETEDAIDESMSAVAKAFAPVDAQAETSD